VEQIEPVRQLYDAGLYLRAYHEAQKIAPLPQWRSTAGRIMAGRLAGNLGGGRLGNALHYLAHREDPASPDAWYYYAHVLLNRRGPLETWQFVRTHNLPDSAPAELRSNWWGIKARLLGIMRDFSAAQKMLAIAEEISPDDPWLAVERCGVLERQDRYEDALAAIMRGLEIRPWYRPAVQAAAHVMQLLDKEGQALELLSQAAQRNESVALVLQLATLQTEMRNYSDARTHFNKAVDLAPLMDKHLREWLWGMQSDAAYFCGEPSIAAELAAKSKNKFYQKISEKLKRPAENASRVMLPVGFVRQHHLTCVPAVVACLGRYWNKPVDHLAVVSEICYDGTPNRALRQWAAEHGWFMIEFRVTWEISRELIDLGIPFALATVEPGSAHLQAVIGYDDLRGTLIIRDPYIRPVTEMVAEIALEHYRSTGPLGIVLVPLDQKPRLDGMQLGDSALYDQLHKVNAALHRHDRNAACTARDVMRSTASDHRLTLTAEQDIAAYDADPGTLLQCYEKLLAQFPDDSALLIGKLQCLRTLERREQRMEILQKKCQSRQTHPIFRELYARELMDDARQWAIVAQILRQVIRAMPLAAASYNDLAGVLWNRREFEQSLELYRFACCMDDKAEHLARSYFIASRHFKQESVVLDLLRERFDAFGTRTGRPASLLFWALEELDRTDEAFDVLKCALNLRPADGSLLLLAANANARHGRLQQADGFMAQARGVCAEREWLRVAADIVLYKGDPREALGLWKKIAAVEPLAMDAHRRVTELLAQSEGMGAAESYLDGLCEKFPHHYPILQLRVIWLRDQMPHRYHSVVCELIRLHPDDAWTRRELIRSLLNQQQADQAAVEAQTALTLDPNNPASHHFYAMAAMRQGRLKEAVDAFKRAIGLSVDYTPAIHELLDAKSTLAQRKDALAFIHSEIVRQTIFGECLSAYRAQAMRVLDARDVLESLQAALKARPDLWQAWSAVTRQLTEMGKLEEARSNALAAVEKFSLLPKLWMDLAGVYAAMADVEGQRAALRQALEINRCWSDPARQLASLYTRLGDLVAARMVLGEIIARAPFDVRNHGMLADVLWRMGVRQKAMGELQRAIKFEPDYQWGWDSLKAWSLELKTPDVSLTLARDLTVSRAGDIRVWLNLARMLHLPEQLDERLAAYKRAIAANPRCVEAYDEQAACLAEVGRMEEAIAACHPEVFNGDVPFELRGRAIWIQYRRGQRPQAIAQMAELIKESPRYYWGTCRLAEWYHQAGDKERYLQTAETLVYLWPVNPVSHGYLGDAHRENGNVTAARKSFRRAVELDAAYTYAVGNLFDIELAAGNLAEASKIETQLSRLTTPERSILARLELAAAQRDQKKAMGELILLCRTPTVESWQMEQALVVLINRNWTDSIGYVVREALNQDDCNINISALVVRCLARRKQWKLCAAFADSLRPYPRALPVALLEYIQQLADQNKFEMLVWFIRRYRKVLLENTELWGKIGYGLKRCGRNRRVIAWMRNWRNRTDIQPWMLANLASAYRAVGQRRKGSEINKLAMQMKSDPGGRTIHALWLAADALLAGKLDDAKAWLGHTSVTSGSPPYHQFIKAIIDAALQRHYQPDLPFASTRTQMIAAGKLYPGFRKTPEIKVLYRQFMIRMSRFKVGFSGMIWFWREALKSL
jgi:tetratricopeptide (TPR) repeat protein